MLLISLVALFCASRVSVDADTATVWYSGGTTGARQIGEAGGVGAAFGPATGVMGVAYGPDAYLYVTRYYDSKVQRLDGITGALDTTWDIAVTSPNGMRFGPGGFLYVAGSQSLVRIDVSAKTQTTVVSGIGAAYDVAFDSSGANAYVTLYLGGVSHVYRYNVATWARDGGLDIVIPNGGLAYGVTLGSDNNIYVSNLYGNIYRYSTSGVRDTTWTASAPGVGNTKGLTFGPDGLLYVGCSSAGIQRVDPLSTTPVLQSFAATGNGPSFLTFHVIDVPASLALAQNGESASTIVKGANASQAESYAAQELQTYLQKVSGALIPIKTTAESAQGTQILVGTLASNNLIKNLQAKLGPIATLESDGFTVKRTGNYLVIAGGGTSGALFGAYDFLEQYLDCRWFAPGTLGEVVPTSSTITIGQIENTEEPDINYRCMGIYGSTQYDQAIVDWMARNKMNNKKTMPHVLSTEYPNLMARGIVPETVSHTLWIDVPGDVYYPTHPEYFPLIGGVRVRPTPPASTNLQLCLSNTDVQNICANAIKSRIATYPGVKVSGIGPNDGSGWCDAGCAPCAAMGATQTDRWINFVNIVAAKVHVTYPDAVIGTYAYSDVVAPSTATPLPYVKIDYVNNGRCYRHTLNDPSCPDNLIRYQQLTGWMGKVEASNLAWEDYTDPYERMPQPTAGVFANDLKWLYSQGMAGYMDDCLDTSSPSWEMLKLNYYVAAKVAWDTTLNYADILDDICTKYYGPASAYMKQYYQALDAAVASSTGAFRRGNIAHVDKILTADVLSNLKSYLIAALGAATPGTNYQARVLGEWGRYQTYVKDLWGKSDIDAPDTPNLVNNPGFENGTTGWSRVYQSGQYTLAVDSTQKYGGANSARATCTGTTGRAFWQQTVTVTPGQKYYFSCWIRVSGTKPPGTTVVWLSNGSNMADHALRYLDGSADEVDVWQKVIISEITAVGSSIGINLMSDDAGVIYFDDVVLRGVQSAEQGLLTGRIDFEDFVGSNWLVPVQVELSQGGSAIRTERQFLNPDNIYAMTSITPGEYDVTFQACKWLPKVVLGVMITDMAVCNVSLTNGDLNGDNQVSAADLDVVLKSLQY